MKLWFGRYGKHSRNKQSDDYILLRVNKSIHVELKYIHINHMNLQTYPKPEEINCNK